MKNFDSFYTELISDQRWVELLRHYKDDTIRKAAEKVWAQLIADKMEDVRPMPENRKHVYNICIKGGSGDKPLPKPFQVVQAEAKQKEEEKEWVPVSDQKRAEYLEKLQAIIKGSTMANGVPRPSYKEQAEEGMDRPKNMPAYPVTSPMEYYVKERHLAYIEENFDPRTAQKLPGAIEESLYNVLYDEKNYQAYAKAFGL